MSLSMVYKELKKVRATWLKEAGYRRDSKNPGTSFIDGIVFGLKLSMDIVAKYRRLFPSKGGRPKGS